MDCRVFFYHTLLKVRYVLDDCRECPRSEIFCSLHQAYRPLLCTGLIIFNNLYTTMSYQTVRLILLYVTVRRQLNYAQRVNSQRTVWMDSVCKEVIQVRVLVQYCSSELKGAAIWKLAKSVLPTEAWSNQSIVQSS